MKMAMEFSAGVGAFVLLFAVLIDAFETIVLPRRVRRRFGITSIFYDCTWTPWAAVARRLKEARRDNFLAFYGPLSLIVLLVVWAICLIFGFALLQWAAGSELDAPEGKPNFGTNLYVSGTTLFTLGLGDVTPKSMLARFLIVLEAGTGFGFLALVIGYIPVLYQAFSRREVNISLLDARAGSPPSAVELLRRHSEQYQQDELGQFLRDWERWSAELLESHISYPTLAYFRSQHDKQSWLAALTMVLDVCALLLANEDNPWRGQARLTFAIARHAAVDLTQLFTSPPRESSFERLPPAHMEELRATMAQAGMSLLEGSSEDQHFAQIRRKYEPYVCALADVLLMPLPAWVANEDAIDDWQSSVWEHASAASRI